MLTTRGLWQVAVLPLARLAAWLPRERWARPLDEWAPPPAEPRPPLEWALPKAAARREERRLLRSLSAHLFERYEGGAAAAARARARGRVATMGRGFRSVRVRGCA